MSDYWGTVPEWFGALGTIGAVVVALKFGLRDGRRLRDERAAAEEDRAAFRQEQVARASAAKRRLAAQVSVTTEKYFAGEQQRIRWTVHNGAEEPISSVAIVQRYPDGSERLVIQTWPMIEARGSRVAEPADYWPKAQMREVQFTDGAGERWQRTELGVLRELAPDDPETSSTVFLQL